MAKHRTPQTGEHPPDDDAHAFRAAVRDVKPLAHTPAPPGLAKPRARARRRGAAAAAAEAADLDLAMPLIASGPETGTASSAPSGAAGNEPTSFRRPGVRTQVLRRLRRGLIPIDAELDLHGLTQSVARDQLADFLSSSRDAGNRCVRIIHGKGYRSGNRGPVLKIAVDRWLRMHGDVMAVTSARVVDGGTGAVYVLLRS